MNRGKNIIYAIIAACIIGIAVVGFFIFRYAPVNENFSELYFENQEQLPDKIRVGEEESFAFTVVSHESDKSSYHYAAKFDDTTIKEGTFTLLPQEEKTLDIKFTAVKSSIAFVDSETELRRANFTLNNIVGFHFAGEEVRQTVPPPKGKQDRLTFPVRFSYDGLSDSILFLEINPDSKDTFHFNSKKKFDIKGKEDIVGEKERDDSLLGQSGYNLIEEEMTIVNDHGKIILIREIIKSQYRYEKKRVSVEVSTGEEQYSIHFWTIVKEAPQTKKSE